MSVINPVGLTRGTPSGNVLAASSRTTALIGHGVAVVGGVQLNEIRTFYNLADAEAAGLAKGGSNNIAWYHVKEFYRMAGNGAKLYFMLVSQALTGATMAVKISDMMNDSSTTMARKLVTQAQGEIYQTGFFLAPPSVGFTPVPLNSMESDSYNAIAVGQAFYDWADGLNFQTQVVVEGRNFIGTGAGATDLRAILNVKAHKVTLVVGQDYTYASSLTNAVEKLHAGIGTYLGSIAIAEISQNVGEYEDSDLKVSNTIDWVTPGFSNNSKTLDRISDLDTLNTKAYAYALTLPGVNGTRWSNDATCTPIEVDTSNNMSEYSVSLGRVMDEIRRRLRKRLIPKVKTRQLIDAATGKLDTNTVAYFNALGDTDMDNMREEGHISNGRTIVNPNSNLLVAPRILEVNFVYVPIGQIDEIKGKVNLKTTL